MEVITIQKKTLILNPLKVRQLNNIKDFVKAFGGELDLSPGSEISAMDALSKVSDSGMLEDLAKIIFPDQENVKKIKWDNLDFNDLVKVGEPFLSVNAPAIDALKRILMTSGLTPAAAKSTPRAENTPTK